MHWQDASATRPRIQAHVLPMRYLLDYAKISGAILALSQACSRGVSMAPNTHNLAADDIDAYSVNYFRQVGQVIL